MADPYEQFGTVVTAPGAPAADPYESLGVAVAEHPEDPYESLGTPVAAPQTQVDVDPAAAAAQEKALGRKMTLLERADLNSSIAPQFPTDTAHNNLPTPQQPRYQSNRPVYDTGGPAPVSGVGNAVNTALSFGEPFANLAARAGEGVGLISPEKVDEFVAYHPFPHDTNRPSGLVGSGVAMVPKLLTGPFAPVLFAAEGAEGAVETQEAQAEKGVTATLAGQITDVGAQAGLQFIMGKLAPGQAISNRLMVKAGLAQVTKEGGVALVPGAINTLKRIAISTGVAAPEGAIQQVTSNTITGATGVDPNLEVSQGVGGAMLQNAVFGAAGQGAHELGGSRVSQNDQQVEAAPQGAPPPRTASENLPSKTQSVEGFPEGEVAFQTPEEVGAKPITPEQTQELRRRADTQPDYEPPAFLNKGRRKTDTTPFPIKDEDIQFQNVEEAGGGKSNPVVRSQADEYAQKAGLKSVEPGPVELDATTSKKIADWYETAKHEPNNPEVKASYDAFKKETVDQYNFLKDKGVKFEPWTEKGQPYADSNAMRADVRDNGHLYYFPGGEMPADHPLAEKVPGTNQTFNDVFRAVHDYFGHAKEGNGFGAKGEENAWAQHSQMYSPEARPAMTAETRGQNSWVNFGPKGEANRANPANTAYAEQKAALPPNWVTKGKEPKLMKAKGKANTPKKFNTSKQVAEFAAKYDPDVKAGNPESAAATAEFFHQELRKLDGGKGKFVLTDAPVDMFTVNEDYQPEVVKKYAKQETEAPPVIGGKAEDGKIVLVDGNTRVRAAKQRGDDTIKAYLPEKLVKEIAPEPPKLDRNGIPVEAKKSRTALKEWADSQGMKVGNPPSIEVLHRRILSRLNDKLTDLPRLPKASRTWGIKALRYWADQKGYDTDVEGGRYALLRSIKSQRENALRTAKGRPPKMTPEKAESVTEESIKDADMVDDNGNVAPKRKITGAAEDILTPILSRMKDISQSFAGELHRTLDTEPLRQISKLNDEMLPHLQAISEFAGKPGSDTYETTKAAFLNGGNALKDVLPENLYPHVEALLNFREDRLKAEKAAGVKIGNAGRDSLPRTVTDYEGLLATMGEKPKSRLEKALREAADRKNRPLTDTEKTEVINSVLAGYGPRKAGDIGGPHTRERSLETVTPEQAKFYADPFSTMLEDMQKSVKREAQAKFFGKNHDPENLMGSIGNKVLAEMKAGRIKGADADELAALVHSRIVGENTHLSGWAKMVKKVGYITSLHHVGSAIRQLPDIARSAARHGLRNAAGAVKDQFFTPESMKLVAHELGVDHHGEVFDAARMSKTLDLATKWNGFQRIDRMTKEIEMNAARRKMQQIAAHPDSVAYNGYAAKWRDFMGAKQFDAAMEAARTGDVKNEDLGFLALANLTEVQPVTMSNMPKAYLDMKNGRMMYMLHTFATQNLDYIRRDIVRKLATPGTRGEGIKHLAALVGYGTLAGVAVDTLADILTGTPLDSKSPKDRISQAALGILGLSRYLIHGLGTSPAKTLLGMASPALSQFDAPVHDLMNVGDGKGLESFKIIPFGDLPYFWSPLGKGWYQNKAEATKQYKAALGDIWVAAYRAHQMHDDATARGLVRQYNELNKQGQQEDNPVRGVVGAVTGQPDDTKHVHGNKPLTFNDLRSPPPASAESKTASGIKKQAVAAMKKGDQAAVRDLIRQYNATGKSLSLAQLKEEAKK